MEQFFISFYQFRGRFLSVFGPYFSLALVNFTSISAPFIALFSAFQLEKSIFVPRVTKFLLYFLRWAQLRAAMVPVTILLEPLSECMLLGLATSWALFYLFFLDPVFFFLLHVLIWFAMDLMLIKVVQNGNLPFNAFEFLVRLFFGT